MVSFYLNPCLADHRCPANVVPKFSRSIEPWERGWCHACVWPGSIKRRLLKKVLDNLGPRHEGYGVAVMMSQTY